LITLEMHLRTIKFIIKGYLLKDKRLQMILITLIFKPKNLILYIEDYIDGEYIPEQEWPIAL
jgi:hypothetical protein